MPHGKICHLEIPSKTAESSKEADRTPDERTRTYIMVDNIAATLKQIEAAGGRILTPRKDIGPGMGAFAAFADPVGNEFGLYDEPTR